MRFFDLMRRVGAFGAATILLGACSHSPLEQQERVAIAKLKDASGASIGTATLLTRGGLILLHLELESLPSGTKAIHLHSTGQCQAPDFNSAGGHLNPGGNSHGKLSGAGKHLGDLENIVIPNDGRVATELLVAQASSDVLSQILDADGTAVVIHADPDDHASQPAGAAGPRIVCGVLVAVDND